MLAKNKVSLPLRFSPNSHNPIIVSAGWDKYVKVGIKGF